MVSWLQQPVPLLEPEPLPQPMLVPMQALMGPIKLGPQPEPMLEPMPQPELVPQPELKLELLLLPELIVQLELKLALIIQPMVPQLESEPKPKPEQQLKLMDQQPGQLLQEFLIIEPEQLLSHQEVQQLIMVLHHLKAFDRSKEVVIGSNH